MTDWTLPGREEPAVGNGDWLRRLDNRLPDNKVSGDGACPLFRRANTPARYRAVKNRQSVPPGPMAMWTLRRHFGQHPS